MDYKESYIIGLYIELDYIYRERDREREGRIKFRKSREDCKTVQR